MKKSILHTLVVIGALSCPALLSAVPFGANNEAFNYAIKAPDLQRFGAGVYYMESKRDIRISGYPFDIEMGVRRTTGYLAYHILPSVNVYAIIGGNWTELNNSGERHSGIAYGGGISLNLLHHYIKEPVPYEDAFRINAGVQLMVHEADFSPNTVRWTEATAALTFALVNHVTGNKYYNPESISLYAGPLLSVIESSDFSVKSKGGLVGGLQIYFTDSVALDLRLEYIDHASGGAGVNILF